MTTTTRRHVVIDTPDGKLTWVEEAGPRGPLRSDPRMNGRPLSGDEFARFRLAAVFGVSPSI